VYIDNPIGVKLLSLEGKDVQICSQLQGYNNLKGIDVSRDTLLSVFKRIAANSGNLDGDCAEEVAAKNNFGVSETQALFAIKVFEQLGLLAFDNGKLTIYRGVKTELTSSPLYNLLVQITNG
jgi:hypothetical protein